MRHLLLEATNSDRIPSENLVHQSGLNSNGSTINIGELIRAKEDEKKFYHSFELVSQTGEDETYKKDIKSEYPPLFFSLTWHGKSADNFLPLQLVPQFPKNTLLHLSAKDLKRKDVEEILTTVLHLGITNLFVIRGDGPSTHGDFTYAIDLIEFINNRFNNKFCIAVAAYPDTHPESPSKQSDLYHLRKKVDAGASFIITQILFDSQRFIEFVKDCRSYGIDVPIIPGILAITNYKTFINLDRICRLTIPKNIHQDLYKIKNNDEQVRKYGINLATRVAKEILSSGVVHGYHLFTLNKISIAQQICTNIISKLVS